MNKRDTIEELRPCSITANDFNVSDPYNNGEQDVNRGRDKFWSWRAPREESFSDWTITVKNVESNEIETYYVHKCALSFGGCEYFTRLFKTSLKVTEKETSSSEFEFIPCVCEAFPVLLDYLYAALKSEKLEIKLEHCVGARFLATYFGVSGLTDRAVSILDHHVDIDRCISLLIDCWSLDDVDLQNICLDQCAKNLDLLPEELIIQLDINGFERLMKSKQTDRLLCSTLCLKYLEQNITELSSDDIKRISSCELLPIISLEAALVFTKIMQDRILSCSKTNENLQQSQMICLSCKKDDCLFDRCSRTFSEHIFELSEEQIDEYLDTLNRKQALKMIKYMSREKLIVSGAGIPFINGIYHLGGKYGGHDNYEKLTIVAGELITCNLYANRGHLNSCWRISAFNSAGHMIGRYYWCNFKGGVHPADERWKLANHGCKPIPRVMRLIRNMNDCKI